MRMKVLLWGCLLSAGLDGQWITGFFAAQNGVQGVSSIAWSKYSHVIHFAAAPNPDGTVNLWYLTQAEISAFASRPAGKKVLVCIKDNDSNGREKCDAHSDRRGLRKNLKGVLRRRMWFVMSVMSVVVGIVVIVRMNGS